MTGPLTSTSKASKRSKLFFLKQYLRNPFGTGGVAPSGRQLAKLMVSKLAPQPSEVIVELGPGTGAFTRELLAQGVEPANLILVEFNKEFVKFLKKEFPNLRIVEGPAQELPQLLKTLEQASVKKIISGIPLRSMKPKECRQIAMAVAAVLDAGGILIQFSYFKVSPVPKAVAAEAGLTGQCVGSALNNVPPAFVWQYTKSA
ncbi:MAG: methyltransferase domain-containing protein [Aestuariivirga sp.]|nr:methyltransferase domain-containing protein [Aestuariivirga sp.]